jgi:hypothetical protein
MLPTPQTQGLKVCTAEGKTKFMPTGLLPTPDRSDRRTATSPQSGLSNYAKNRLLPTPKAQDEISAKYDRGRGNLGEIIQWMSKSQTGQSSQLSALFTTEMMGFPIDWLVLPFLVGEERQLKPAVTQ